MVVNGRWHCPALPPIGGLANVAGGPYGITVNAVAPGPIDTDIMGGPLTSERKADLAKDLVVNRVGVPQDVAATLVLLLSDEAGFISGADGECRRRPLHALTTTQPERPSGLSTRAASATGHLIRR
ncbi:SDR family oxidoreductase [Actinopolymorpha pittospori]|uniref:Enoyl-(Acyl carrier protein) reductase n=1 Tax=Actinopolymorpha pittospori TaxID=648752 RepID=A0A927MY29_9ACTN|nr:SDR family oxidoreductase [Actinopolymorpha pittospori]MBE1609051.1 hypothetical protein [Actinopolymorpha pittospori]